MIVKTAINNMDRTVYSRRLKVSPTVIVMLGLRFFAVAVRSLIEHLLKQSDNAQSCASPPLAMRKSNRSVTRRFCPGGALTDRRRAPTPPSRPHGSTHSPIMRVLRHARRDRPEPAAIFLLRFWSRMARRCIRRDAPFRTRLDNGQTSILARDDYDVNDPKRGRKRSSTNKSLNLYSASAQSFPIMTALQSFHWSTHDH